MAIRAKEIGHNQTYYLLYDILKELDRLNGIIGTMAASMDLEIVSTSTSGNIDLNMASLTQRAFEGTVAIAANKTWSFSNVTNAIQIPFFKFTVSVADVEQQMPLNVKMLQFEGNWDDGTKIWTPTEIGDYLAEGSYDGTTWYLKIYGPF